MPSENNPWILIRLIMTLVCIFLLWDIFSYPSRFPGLDPRTRSLAPCGRVRNSPRHIHRTNSPRPAQKTRIDHHREDCIASSRHDKTAGKKRYHSTAFVYLFLLMIYSGKNMIQNKITSIAQLTGDHVRDSIVSFSPF